jgi:hypothetical protein
MEKREEQQGKPSNTQTERGEAKNRRSASKDEEPSHTTSWSTFT